MSGRVNQFLGGSPLSVAIRLVLISIAVGILLSWLSWSPADIFRWAADFLDWLWVTVFGSLEDAVDYFLLGAAIVVPIFLILRLLRMSRR